MVRMKKADVAKFGNKRNWIKHTINKIMDTAWFMMVAVPVLVDFKISRKSKLMDSKMSASAPDRCQFTPDIIVSSRTGAARVVASGATFAAPAAAVAAAEPPVNAIRL